MSNKIRKILVNLFMVEDAAGLDKDKVAERTEDIIFHAECEKSVRIGAVSNRMNSGYSWNWKSLDAYLY